jgi:coenzyme F420 hydrogenase subunit beta
MAAGKSSKDLENDVLSQGLCTSCGACVNVCPYIKVVKDRVAVIEPCGLDQGKCYDFCPRTITDMAALERAVFGRKKPDISLGFYTSIEMAQAKDSSLRCQAQYGGVVSALMEYAIESGTITDALLTRPFDGGLMPKSLLVEGSSEVLEFAGSNYIASAPLATLNKNTKQKKAEVVGVVGIPCQVIALRKMQAFKNENEAKKVKLVIGLFCTWALTYKGLHDFLRDRVEVTRIKRFDIPPPPANILVVETETETKRFSLDEIRKFVKPTCSICFDMTSELADISVGMVEGIEDWNTLIVRTAEGKRLIDNAKSAGIIVTQPLDEARFDHLRAASALKKKRALAEIVKRTGDKNNLLYLKLGREQRKKYL